MGDEGTSSQDELPMSQETFQFCWENTMQSLNTSSQGEMNFLNMEFLEAIPGMMSDVLPNVNFQEISDNVTLPTPLDHVLGGDQGPTEEPLTILTDLDIATIQVPYEPIPIPTTSASNLGPHFPEPLNPCVSLPAVKDLDGFYGFNISFPVAEERIKDYSYSSITSKVYVVKDCAWPVNFSTDRVTPPGVVLRAMGIYILPDHASDIVMRCVSHRIEDSERGVPFPEHLIHCDSSRSSYEQDPVTKRFSVVLPYENPQCGESFSTYIFKFTCWGSCVGGLNRRPLTVVFTLEQGGIVVGRRSAEVRICACPRRDRHVEEDRLIKSKLNRMSSSNSDGNLSTFLNQMSSCSATKKRKPNLGMKDLHNVDSSCSASKKRKSSPGSQDLKDICPNNSSSSQKIMSDSSSQDSSLSFKVYDAKLYNILRQFKRLYGAYESLRNASNLVSCVEQCIKDSENSVVLDKKSSDESD